MDIQEIIKNRYEELPADIQQAIKSTDLASKFNLIANKHSLHIDQSGALQTETILVMLGLESTNDYVNNLQKGLEISRNEALSLAGDVNREILDSIRTSLRVLQEQNEKADEQTQTPITPPKPVTEPVRPTIPLPPPNLPTSSGPSPLEQAGQFTLEKEIVHSSSPQYKETNINREQLLKSIEATPITLADHLLTTPISSPQKVEEKKPNTVDPYREQIK